VGGFFSFFFLFGSSLLALVLFFFFSFFFVWLFFPLWGVLSFSGGCLFGCFFFGFPLKVRGVPSLTPFLSVFLFLGRVP